MPTEITFKYECDCGEDAISKTIDLTSEPGKVTIDISLELSQLTLKCRSCGRKYYTGDINVLSEDEV